MSFLTFLIFLFAVLWFAVLFAGTVTFAYFLFVRPVTDFLAYVDRRLNAFMDSGLQALRVPWRVRQRRTVVGRPREDWSSTDFLGWR